MTNPTRRSRAWLLLGVTLAVAACGLAPAPAAFAATAPPGAGARSFGTHRGTGANLAASAVTAPGAAADAQAVPDAATFPLDNPTRRVTDLGHAAEALVGPLPALAATPFFGLAALSAAGIAARSDWVRTSDRPWVRAFRDNALIRESRRYATWPVFLTLAGLALVTYLANSGKIRGLGGKLLRIVEDSSSALVYFALSLGALHLATGAAAHGVPPGGSGAAAAAGATVAHLGMLDGALDTLIACGLAASLAAMMVTRYACDILIWLVPIPFVDFAFETFKKVLTLGFLCLYFFAPAAAAAVALVLLVPALLISPWAVRVARFAFHVLLRPLLLRLLPALTPRLLDPHLLARYAPDPATRRAAADLAHTTAAPATHTASAAPLASLAGVTLAADATALAVRGLPHRAHGCLLATPAGVAFVTLSAFGRRRVRPLPGPAEAGAHLRLVPALLWTELRVETPAGASLARIALPRALAFDDLRARLGAIADPTATAPATGPAAAPRPPLPASA